MIDYFGCTLVLLLSSLITFISHCVDFTLFLLYVVSTVARCNVSDYLGIFAEICQVTELY